MWLAEVAMIFHWSDSISHSLARPANFAFGGLVLMENLRFKGIGGENFIYIIIYSHTSVFIHYESCSYKLYMCINFIYV